MTCHWIRPNVRHIGILHLVSISTTSPQSTCHFAPVCEILFKSDHPRYKIMMSCRFSKWWISDILDFRGPIMDSLKSQCTTSCRSSIDTIALYCFVFEKIAFLHFGYRRTNKQTDKQVDKPIALSRSRCRERRLNNRSSNATGNTSVCSLWHAWAVRKRRIKKRIYAAYLCHLLVRVWVSCENDGEDIRISQQLCISLT